MRGRVSILEAEVISSRSTHEQLEHITLHEVRAIRMDLQYLKAVLQGKTVAG